MDGHARSLVRVLQEPKLISNYPIGIGDMFPHNHLIVVQKQTTRGAASVPIQIAKISEWGIHVIH